MMERDYNCLHSAEKKHCTHHLARLLSEKADLVFTLSNIAGLLRKGAFEIYFRVPHMEVTNVHAPRLHKRK